MKADDNSIGSGIVFNTPKHEVHTILLDPGDEWEVGEPRDSSNSLRRYALDFEHALSRPPDTSDPIPMTKLREAANNFVHRCNHKNNRLLLKALLPAFVRLNDLGIDVELSYRRGVSEVTGKHPDIVTSSHSLYYCLLYEWGGDTLAVNGRYQVPPGGNP